MRLRGAQGRRFLPGALTAFLLLALAACGGEAERAAADRSTALARFSEDAFTERGLRARYAGATRRSFSDAHGTQVAYLSAGGRSYLWYPGNRRVVAGEWEVRAGARRFAFICFRYDPGTFNPVTRRPGGAWACQRADDFLLLEREVQRGDLFALSSGRVPFVMPKRDISLAALAARLGAGGG
ncbi:MAG: hypothetical protein AAFY59_10110 [Pseudomonadota bacterium]